MFCKMILDYENYEETSRADLLRRRHTSSPLGSTGSGAESNMSSSQEDSLGMESSTQHSLDMESPTTQHSNVIISDEDSDDEGDVTCYCKKPYGGRPMIECSCCSTWVHLACAKVKRTAIPDMWYCALCKTKSTKGGAKARARARARKGSSSSQALLGPPSSSIKRKS
jgi:hypothetical protein